MQLVLALLLMLVAGIFAAYLTGVVYWQVSAILAVVIGLAIAVGIIVGTVDWLLRRSRTRRDL